MTGMRSFIKKIICLTGLMITAITLFAAEVNVRYVGSEVLEVKASASVSAKTVEKLTYGDAVRLVLEKGKWSQITTESSKKGWVLTASLSKRKLTSKNMTVNTKELALAGKGANAGIEAAIDQNYNEHFDEVDKVEAGKVSEEKILLFIKEGQLNGGEE